jgi:hypothetical protein
MEAILQILQSPIGKGISPSLFGVAAVLMAAGPPAALGQDIPMWRLAEVPVFEVGRSGDGLFRVQSATALPNGTIAIADQGNFRIVLLSPEVK